MICSLYQIFIYLNGALGFMTVVVINNINHAFSAMINDEIILF